MKTESTTEPFRTLTNETLTELELATLSVRALLYLLAMKAKDQEEHLDQATKEEQEGIAVLSMRTGDSLSAIVRGLWDQGLDLPTEPKRKGAEA